MEWLYEQARLVLKCTADQIRFASRLRKHNQVTFPKAVLAVIVKELNNQGVNCSLEDIRNSEIVLETKAVHYNNIWYRISTIVENKS